MLVIEEPITYPATPSSEPINTFLYQLVVLRDIVKTVETPTSLADLIFHVQPLSRYDFKRIPYKPDTIFEISGTKVHKFEPITLPRGKSFSLRQDVVGNWDGFYHLVAFEKSTTAPQTITTSTTGLKPHKGGWYRVWYAEDQVIKANTASNRKSNVQEQINIPDSVVFGTFSPVPSIIVPHHLNFQDVLTALDWYNKRRLFHWNVENKKKTQIALQAQGRRIGYELQSLYDQELVKLPQITQQPQPQPQSKQTSQSVKQVAPLQPPQPPQQPQPPVKLTQAQKLAKHQSLLIQRDRYYNTPHSSLEFITNLLPTSHRFFPRFAQRYAADTLFWLTHQRPRTVSTSSLQQLLTVLHTPFNSASLITERNQNGSYERALQAIRRSRQQQQQREYEQHQQLCTYPHQSAVAMLPTYTTKKAQNAAHAKVTEEIKSSMNDFLAKQQQQESLTRPVDEEVLYAPSITNVEYLVLTAVLTNTDRIPTSIRVQYELQDQTAQQFRQQHPGQRPPPPQLQPLPDGNQIKDQIGFFRHHQLHLDAYRSNEWNDKSFVVGFTGASLLPADGGPQNGHRSMTRVMWGLFNDVSVFRTLQSPRTDKGEWSLHRHPYLYHRHFFDDTTIRIAMDNKMKFERFARRIAELTMQIQEHARSRNLSQNDYQNLLRSKLPLISPHESPHVFIQHTTNYTTHRVYQLVNHPRVTEQISTMLATSSFTNDEQLNTLTQPNLPLITPAHNRLEILQKQIRIWDEDKKLPIEMRNPDLPPQRPQLTPLELESVQPIAHTPFIIPLPLFHPIVPLPNLTTLVNIQTKAPWSFLGTSLQTSTNKYRRVYLPWDQNDPPVQPLDKFVWENSNFISRNDFIEKEFPNRDRLDPNVELDDEGIYKYLNEGFEADLDESDWHIVGDYCGDF
jgi:hypothetical protein